MKGGLFGVVLRAKLEADCGREVSYDAACAIFEITKAWAILAEDLMAVAGRKGIGSVEAIAKNHAEICRDEVKAYSGKAAR
jgi:hypothetical protein